ncbi:MAG: glycosyltransferase family 4 protein [Chloroflexi bacterium]|nr:glycosyltransferase family 4 protein [Chloroflexota bacterium]
MRILHTCEFYYPHVGGAEEVVRQISERLARRGHQVTVATSADPARNYSELNGVRISEFAIRGNVVKGFEADKNELKRFRTHMMGNYDLIMNYAAQSWPTDLTLTMLDQLECPKVIAPCGYSGLVGWRRLFYALYFRKLPSYLREYDKIVYHSRNYRDKQFGDQCGLANYTIIPNGVDSSEFQRVAPSFRNQYNIKTPFLLLSVGNHYRVKGHHRLMEAFERLERNDVTLAIIGRDLAEGYRSCWADCYKAAQCHPRIILVADAPRPVVVSAFLEADVFWLSSYVEAFPLVILEAMASGTPFVSYDVGNVKELSGGMVVPSSTVMAERTNHLLNNSALREELGALGRQTQRLRYDWEGIIDHYEQLYVSLVNR